MNKTNHSLCATGATDLYAAAVPEKLIQQRTGHRSLKALRIYERTTGEQKLAVSKILTSGSRINHTQAQQSGMETPGESAQESSTLATLPEQQNTTNTPSQMLEQLCQVSQTQSFAPNLNSLFGVQLTVSSISTLVNPPLQSSFRTRKTFIMKCQKKWTRLCRPWTLTFDCYCCSCVHLHCTVHTLS